MVKLENGVLIVSDKNDIEEYCKQNGITREEFNVPIKVDMEDCSRLLMGCKEFNSSVEFGKSVKKCVAMLADCEKFNQPIDMSNSAVENCSHMLSYCKKFDNSIKFSPSTKKCANMLDGCEEYNHEIDIPEGVTDTSLMFLHCKKLDKFIKVPQSNKDFYGMFGECESLTIQPELPENAYSLKAIQRGNGFRALPACTMMFVGCDNLQFDSSVIPAKYTDGYARKLIHTMYEHDDKNCAKAITDYENNTVSQKRLSEKDFAQSKDINYMFEECYDFGEPAVISENENTDDVSDGVGL